ncbi:type II secretion system F family protein [Vibrio sp. ZSDZ65]|uniref:Type II secretion system F family protein n=1 Tax=Vibrio qingdaonensis TaxID=2829491 RepID=A0A9X3HV92_9VIBR|nr:type II secretion system F family protein [Vibrio qingdaonensis]MCW8344512.1 type II secretion system F family protein [Vibrio qingdaonensis]
MILPLSIFFVIVAIAFIINEGYRSRARSKRLSTLMIKNQPLMPIKTNRIIIGFAKEQRKDLEQKLLDAGYYNKNLAKYYLPSKVVVAILASVFVFFIDIPLLHQLAVLMIVAVSIIIVPDILLEARRRYMVRKISRSLPYLLDMMSVCVQTGMTIEAALDYLHAELKAFDRDLSYQIKKTSDSSKIHGIEKALNDLNYRLPAPEVQSFVLTIVQNLHYGTSVANILSDLAEDMRRIQLLRVEEKVGKLAAKMSVPLILLIMFPIVILILAPGVMQVDLNLGQ